MTPHGVTACLGSVAIDKAVARRVHGRDTLPEQPRPARSWRAPREGEGMAEVMLAEISPVQADLGMIVARSAQRYGPKPALVAGGRRSEEHTSELQSRRD